jgi:hypothetical protein
VLGAKKVHPPDLGELDTFMRFSHTLKDSALPTDGSIRSKQGGLDYLLTWISTNPDLPSASITTDGDPEMASTPTLSHGASSAVSSVASGPSTATAASSHGGSSALRLDMQPWEVRFKDLRLHHGIGQGSFGQVKRAVPEQNTAILQCGAGATRWASGVLPHEAGWLLPAGVPGDLA